MATINRGGRPPKSTAVKIAEGNPGKRRLNTNEPTPERGIPPKPTALGAVASKEWDRITPMLFELGLLTAVDGAALAAYCANFQRWHEAETLIKASGLVIEAERGPVRNPAVGIANESMAQMHKFLVEFGLTPASRIRLIAIPSAAKDGGDDELKKPKPILRLSAGGQG